MIYLSLSFFFFGRGLIGHFSTTYIGSPGEDLQQAIWSMAWIPHAVEDHLNPLFTRIIFAPSGINLTWMAFDPMASLLGWPLTQATGAVTSYNVMCLLAPALAGWAAFLLCDYITDSWWPSMVGGYLFGFSPYLLAMLHNDWVYHALVFPVPLTVLAILRSLEGTMRRWPLAISLTTLMVTQFLFSTEIFATATAFGAIIIALALCVLDRARRSRLFGLFMPIALSYIFTLIILSPYIYYIVAFGIPNGPIWETNLFANQPLSAVLPTSLGEVGSFGVVRTIQTWLPQEQLAPEGFLGPALIAIIIAYAGRHLREPAGKLLVYSFLVIFVLSFGTRLEVGGHTFAMLPGVLLSKLPELNKAMPSRFAMYYTLAAAVMVAIWLASGQARALTRGGAAVLAILPLIPVLSARHWTQSIDAPAFFAQGHYREYLRPGEIVVILPYGWRGNSMLWQVEANFYFRMAGGHLGAPPYEYQRWPVVDAMYKEAYLPDLGVQFMAFLAAHRVNAVILDNRAASYWQDLLSTLAITPIRADGVSIYRIGQNRLAAYQDLTPLELERRADAARLEELIASTENYLARGGDIATLSPQKLEELGLIRNNWFGGPDIRISNALWLKPGPDALVDVGILGSEAALDPLAARYGPLARQLARVPIDSPFNPGGKASLQLMVLRFDRPSLAQADGVRFYSRR